MMSISISACRHLTVLIAFLCCFAAQLSSFGRPRQASPPMPEGQIAVWRFDDPNWIAKPSSNAVAAENLALAESWSGYALDMSGGASRLVLPMLSAPQKPSVAANSGTVRFWFAPTWASASAGGQGPGDWARLFEVGDEKEQFWVTLAVDPTGTAITLASTSGQTPAVYLQAPLQWQASEWHQLAIIYTQTNTTLVVDGAVVASTENAIVWPGSAQWPQLTFAIGSGLDGGDQAKGQFEELTTFAFPQSMEFLTWNYQAFAPVAALGPITIEEWAARRSGRGFGLDGSMEMMANGAPPPPPFPGGGGGGTNTPPILPPSGPGLKLTQPLISGSALTTTLREADTNSAYDIFQRLGLHGTNKWARAAVGDIGQTNFSLAAPSTNHAFFIAAAVVDSDFDGLPDAYEELVLGTSPLSADSNGNGIPDGNEDRNGNSLPDYVDYNGLTRAIAYTTRTNAYEGGQPGEITVRLPSSAPTNNTLVKLHLGGLADYDGDYWLAKPNGTRVTNDLFFVIGEREIRLQVHATNDTVQSSIVRKVSVSLESSANFQLDPNRADVMLIDNDLPIVAIVASDPKAGEPKGTNVNPGAFVIRRDGMLTNALTVNFTLTGSATAGSDFTNFSSSVVIPASNNVVTIPVNPIHDTNYEGNENVIATLQPSASYVVDVQAPNGAITIADNDLPLVYFVGTDLVATEYNSLKPATVTLRRTGITAQPLTVALAIGGTATEAADYQFLTNVYTFVAGATDVTFNVRPLTDSHLEAAESVVLVLKGGRAYDIGSSNMVTVFIDDDNTTQYNVLVPYKQSASYVPGLVDNPAVIEVQRFGRSSQPVNLGFMVKTNTQQGPQLTFKYRVYGSNAYGNNVVGTNAVFAAFATNVYLHFTAEAPVTQGGYGVDVNFPSLGSSVYAVFWQPAWQALDFQVVDTNVVEGGVQGTVRVSRAVTAPVPMDPAFIVEGPGNGIATPRSFGQADVTLTNNQYFRFPSNALSVDITFTALTDGTTEGWEDIIFRPRQDDVSFGWRHGVRRMGFVRENVANPDVLPQGDYDADGLGDRWEVTHGFDPFTPGEAVLDPDKDGLINEDEYRSNTDPNDADTDNDGLNDFVDLNLPANEEDFVEIRLVTRTTGKINNGQNCAVCHTAQLKVGEFSHFSKPRTNFTEKSFFFRKGTNYPIYLSELGQNLPPVSPNNNDPTTSATYTAAVLPVTNQPPAFVVQDPQARLGTNKLWSSSFTANPSVAIGSLIVPKIEVTFTNLPGNVALDANPNAGGGMRVYPDALNPNDFLVRNRVRVKVKTIPALPGQQVLLKSFDVDDPFVHPAYFSGLHTDPTDAGGEKGDDNLGSSPAGQLVATTLTLDGQGEGVTEYAVSFQPGNNFRVAAILNMAGAEAHLDQLQVTNANAPFYVAAGTNALSGFAGALSPMLTTWRKLHLEFDTMGTPPSSGPEVISFSGSVDTVIPNKPMQGHSIVRMRHTIGAGTVDRFEDGKLEISGYGPYVISNSHTAIMSGQFVTAVEINGVPGMVPSGVAATLYDDDNHYLSNDALFPSLLTLQSPPLPATNHTAACLATNAARFAIAYITLLNANTQGFSTETIIPFKRQAGMGPFDVGNQELKGKDRPEFWTFTVVFGFEGDAAEDYDPNEESGTLGLTQKSFGGLVHSFSVIYLEVCREEAFRGVSPSSFMITGSTNFLRDQYIQEIYATVAHEMGHAPKSSVLRFSYHDHSEGALMQAGSGRAREVFSPMTVRRFRETTQWTR
jgi:hypothetical protein